MARAFDVAGNSNSASGTVRVDRVAPSATFLCNGSTCGSGWYNGPVTVTLNASDATSGVVPASVQISTDGGATWVTTATLTTNGSHNVQGRAVDVAGNTINTSWVVQIDTVAPAVTGTLSGGVMGGGGIYLSGPVTLTCTATDATSGVAGITYAPGVATAPGTTTLSCTATDNAGNSSSYSVAVAIDGTAPNASFQYSGSYCSGGWYNTPVSPAVLASDMSGIGSVSFWVDGQPWSAGELIKDGIHALTAVVSDVAGNTTHISDTLQVDTYPPISSWVTKSDTWVGGKTTLDGQSQDWTSGIALVEISFDGGATWISIGKTSPWSYSWDTIGLQVPDGPHTILARARDHACNQEHTARVVVNVDNTPPKIDLKDSLNIMGRTTTVITFDAGSGFDHGIVTITGNGIQPVKISFTSDNASVSWDGLGGDGRTAPFGVFDVTVDAWDRVGNHSTTRGYWMRPAPIQPTEAPAAVSQPVVKPPEVIPPSPSQKPAETILAAPVSPYVLWPSVGLAAILVCFGSSALLDRRAQSVRALMNTIKEIRRNEVDLDD